jgi:type II secretory pathway pseudopilin PulG
VISRRGFTYVELGVVIVVVGICSAMVVPNLASWQRGREERIFQQNVLAIAGEARARAIESGNTVALGYDKTERKLQAVEEREPKAEVLRSVPVPEAIEASTFSADKDESPPDGWRVPFFPDGETAGGGIEFQSGNRTFHLWIPRGNLRPTIGKGVMPEPGQDRWKAGSYERR